MWNVLTYIRLDDKTLWFVMPVIIWGVAVIIHYVLTIVLFDDWWGQTEEQIAERLTKG